MCLKWEILHQQVWIHICLYNRAMLSTFLQQAVCDGKHYTTIHVSTHKCLLTIAKLAFPQPWNPQPVSCRLSWQSHGCLCGIQSPLHTLLLLSCEERLLAQPSNPDWHRPLFVLAACMKAAFLMSAPSRLLIQKNTVTEQQGLKCSDEMCQYVSVKPYRYCSLADAHKPHSCNVI